MTTLTVSHCEVCSRRLVPSEETGVCFRCQQGGVKFARGWVRGLRLQGRDYDEINEIVWAAPDEDLVSA